MVSTTECCRSDHPRYPYITVNSNRSSQHVNKYLIWAHIRFYFYWADSSNSPRLWGWFVLDRASGVKIDRRLNCVVSCSFLLCNGRLMEEVVPILGCLVRQPPSLSLSYSHVSLHDWGICCWISSAASPVSQHVKRDAHTNLGMHMTISMWIPYVYVKLCHACYVRVKWCGFCLKFDSVLSSGWSTSWSHLHCHLTPVSCHLVLIAHLIDVFHKLFNCHHFSSDFNHSLGS